MLRTLQLSQVRPTTVTRWSAWRLVRRLLEAGAAWEGHREVIALLVDAVDPASAAAAALLTMLAGRGHLECVDLVLARGVPVDVDDGAGQTPLIHALHKGQGAVARLLLEKGARVDVTVGAFKETPRSLARESKLDDVVALIDAFFNDDDYSELFVGGDLRVRTRLSGSPVRVRGDLTVRETLYGNSFGLDALEVAGRLRAGVLIDEGHEFPHAAPLRAGVFASPKLYRRGFVDSRELFERARAGAPIIKQKPSPRPRRKRS